MTFTMEPEVTSISEVQSLCPAITNCTVCFPCFNFAKLGACPLPTESTKISAPSGEEVMDAVPSAEEIVAGAAGVLT